MPQGAIRFIVIEDMAMLDGFGFLEAWLQGFLNEFVAMIVHEKGDFKRPILARNNGFAQCFRNRFVFAYRRCREIGNIFGAVFDELCSRNICQLWHLGAVCKDVRHRSGLQKIVHGLEFLIEML